MQPINVSNNNLSIVGKVKTYQTIFRNIRFCTTVLYIFYGVQLIVKL